MKKGLHSYITRFTAQVIAKTGVSLSGACLRHWVRGGAGRGCQLWRLAARDRPRRHVRDAQVPAAGHHRSAAQHGKMSSWSGVSGALQQCAQAGVGYPPCMQHDKRVAERQACTVLSALLAVGHRSCKGSMFLR